MKKIMPKGLYGATAENMSSGRDNIFVVKEMLDAGIRVLQYRDKNKTKLEKFKQCEIIRKITLDYNAFFVVNDDIDIAIAVQSDGLHVGQTDLPIEYARNIVGQNMVIGLSTQNHQQAEEATIKGADYIGVGPIFTTSTKTNIGKPLGLSYLDYCMKNMSIPKTAIGGIKISNLKQIIKYNPENICIISEITSANNINLTVKKIINIINQGCKM
ncbi:MAG: thiamine phosphate synthase [Endomicrobium sp.]|jgi:thiamine-phosphate pyrophosphorylase|nr:thiamine phosphate synthase [Endomicrobium sp.]